MSFPIISYVFHFWSPWKFLQNMPLIEGEHDRRIRLNFVNTLEERFRRKWLTFLSIESGRVFCVGLIKQNKMSVLVADSI